MSKRILSLACAAAAFVCSSASADMEIAGGSAFYNQSDRFYVPSGGGPPKDFAFSQFNFSAVGNTNGAAGTGFWGTLISPDFILEANHFHADPGATFTFETTNDPTGPTVSFTAGPGMEVGNTDLYVAKLTTSTAGSGLIPYAIASNNEIAQTNAQIYGVGIPFRVGTNNIDGFTTITAANTPSPGEAGRVSLYDYNPSTSPFENKLQSGDSGGPSFVANGNQLLLTGIHWFNYDADPANGIQYGGSGDTYVSAYIDAINATMKLLDPTTTDSVTVVPYAVPEPSALALTAVGMLGLVARALRARRASAR